MYSSSSSSSSYHYHYYHYYYHYYYYPHSPDPDSPMMAHSSPGRTTPLTPSNRRPSLVVVVLVPLVLLLLLVVLLLLLVLVLLLVVLLLLLLCSVYVTSLKTSVTAQAPGRGGAALKTSPPSCAHSPVSYSACIARLSPSVS
jgi:hypothetical protein